MTYSFWIVVLFSMILGFLLAGTHLSMETTAKLAFCDGVVNGDSTYYVSGDIGYTVYCTTKDGTRDIGAQCLFGGAVFTCLGTLVLLGSPAFVGLLCLSNWYNRASGAERHRLS